ncbi:TIGR02391 family protein [Dokdonella soli]|uniref:Conserved hypothetical protein CHP02391 domain-containing protein n=1 Tax=Dokdonella soli TaxID=529810 RepID=A0ABN1IDT8_9GAMM
MADLLECFERIVRSAGSVTEARSDPIGGSHPFDDRNIHTRIEGTSKKLFDDGHYASATFEAYKFIDKEVSALAGISDSGVKLMMKAFSEQSPLIKLTDLSTISEKDEQEGYKFIFSGSVMAIRNPRGHEYGVVDSPTECLDHLSLASLLLRRLERAKK